MYIKKLTIWLFMLLAVALSACSDATDVEGGAPDVPSEGVVLTLKLPNFTKNTVATRATEPEQTISSLCVLFYDADDKYLDKSTIPSDSIKLNDDGTYKVRVKAVPETATLHLVANTDVTDNDAKDNSGMNNLYNATRSNTLNLNAPVCWGSVKVDSLLSPNTKVSLFRMFAKASVEKDPKLTAKFEITGFKLINTATEGTIATKSFTDVVLPSSVDFSHNTAYSTKGSTGELPELPFYETPANNAFMIIKAKYDGGTDTYYKVAFLKKEDGTLKPMALLRNHHYTVKVTAVNHAGYANEQEAIDNLPDNRISVLVVDDNPKIVDMIACKDYELGVCAEQEVMGDATEATITFVTTKPTGGSKYNEKVWRIAL